MTSRLAALALAASIALGPGARAQDDPDRGAAEADAHTHFERGIELFNEGRFDAALAEFQRAYDVAPAFAVLYNVGRVQAELGRPVEAARALERYLREGGDAISSARRAEVEELLARQLERIGHVRVETNVPGSVVSLDGLDVATTPLGAALEVGAGRHTLGVRAPGYESVTRALDLAGGVEERVVVELRPDVTPRGSLRITATLPGVRVRVDGVDIGLTPLDATVPVPAGDHDVAGERAGYLADERRVHVEDGAELTVHLRPDVDPTPGAGDVGTLALALPDSRLVVRIDGAERSALGPLVLPIGTHHLEIDAEDREPWAGEVVVPAGSLLELTPPLAWTDRARRDHAQSAEAGRSAGLGLVSAGGALFLAGMVVALWNEVEIGRTDARVTALGAEITAMGGCDATPLRCEEIRPELTALSARQNEQNVIRGVSITGAAVGAALAAVGIGLLVIAPSDEAIDAAAHAELRVGPGGLTLHGTF